MKTYENIQDSHFQAILHLLVTDRVMDKQMLCHIIVHAMHTKNP